MSPSGDEHYDSYGGEHGDGRLTRTRLPDGDGDAFGGGRRPRPTPKPSRSLLTVVSVVVLLIAAIAFANRGGGGDGSASDGGSKSSRDKNEAAQPTAPTGQRPVSGKDTTTGIATGFPRTEQGAQSAAANYAVALGSVEMYTRESRHAIVNTVAAPQAIPEFEQVLDKAYSSNVLHRIGLSKDGKAPEGLTFVSRTIPIGTKIKEYSANTATIDVWSTGLSGIAGEGSKRPVKTDWFTVTLKLSWTGNDWKALAHSLTDGPAPVSGDVPVSGADQITEAVEGYGGFTYAR
ncbi:hypothetical protein ACMA1D_27240 [Streptomyces sp. 796.1]|uniref:hypothetical protein n=1 Tax=Streptomyces sp. 796.1 TaxID=3163029 RepID=UPI0039C99F19